MDQILVPACCPPQSKHTDIKTLQIMSWLCQRDAEKAKNSHSSYSSHLFYLGSFSGTAMDTGMFNTLLELLLTINVSLVDTVSKLGVKYPK